VRSETRPRKASPIEMLFPEIRSVMVCLDRLYVVARTDTIPIPAGRNQAG
jgi:hypothetical protein